MELVEAIAQQDPALDSFMERAAQAAEALAESAGQWTVASQPQLQTDRRLLVFAHVLVGLFAAFWYLSRVIFCIGGAVPVSPLL